MMPATFETLINTYIDNKVGITEDFIEPSLAEDLKKNLLQLYSSDQFHAAGTGNNTIDHNEKNRTDLIHWLDRKNENASENCFFNRMDEFILYLNNTCYTGINSYEFHYTLYPVGSFYKRHRDQFQDDDSRQFSMIMYLNHDWQLADGGQLCIYHDDYEQMIAPENGKIVFFKSSELEHKVLMTNKARMSITGWLKKSPRA